MNTRVALSCLLAIAAQSARGVAHADERSFRTAPPYHYDRELANDDDAQSARALTGVGAALTGVGAALALAAVALGIVDAVGSLHAADAPLGPRAVAALGAGAGGAVMLAAGVPLLAVGRHRSRKLERAALRLTGFALAPLGDSRGIHGGAAQLGFRF